MEKIRINLFDLLTCFTNSENLISEQLAYHNQRVAYLAYRLAVQMNLPIKQQYELFIASLVHDIGALSSGEKLELVEKEPANANSHAFRGAKLIEEFKPLQKHASIIRYHHIPWNYGNGSKYKGKNVPLESHIVHLSDQVCIAIKSEGNILSQVPDILSSIQRKSGSLFKPDMVEALVELSGKEYIWLDLVSPNPANVITNEGLFAIISLDIDDVVDLASVFSKVIDFRSRFTASHSAGVAKTAERLAELVGFSPYECKMMLIAGYLHDLGKIAISDEILEKPSKLNVDEFNEMRAHTYYTYRLLEPIEQFNTINQWASFHHERLDGRGYPFHIAGSNLSLGSRIMAVADVFTAITENRPYRQGMTYNSAKNVLDGMVVNNAIDGYVVSVLMDHYDEIYRIRESAQVEAVKNYNNFMRIE
jgi:HD-GYP domain-containing protein (c-di-GMP phosphodiesterase class II)